MKILKITGVIVGLLALVVVVVLGAHALGNHYINAQDTANKTTAVTCKKLGTNHPVTLQDDKANPPYLKGKLCDTMTFTNRDTTARLMAFGPHDHHQPYDGVTEHLLEPNQSFTITLDEPGNYHFHDHIGDVIQGDFTVTK